MTEERSEAVAAGRGVLFIAGAKLYFMIAGAAIEFALPSLLDRFAYGAYGVVAQWVSNINNVVVTGTIQTVSRSTTADPARADEVKAAGLRMHLLVGLPLAVVFAATAPLWAAIAEDPGKTGLLALSAGIVALYAFYSVFIGAVNGARAFHKQAALDVTFMTLRAGGIIGAALLGLGVWGAIGAWVAAAGAILVVAAVVVGVPRRPRIAGAVRPMVTFLAGVAGYLILVNLMMSADQLLLKVLSTGWFRDHPQWLLAHGATADSLATAAARQADGQVAYYRAVQNLARLPYQLMIAVTFVVFPLVSRATLQQDEERTRTYIRTTLRYSLVLAALMGVVLAANSTEILDLPFPREYAVEGGAALAILALGNVAFAVFTIAGTILNSAGRTSDAIAVAGVTLLLLVVGLVVGIPRSAPGHEVLTVCASATGGAMLLGALASAWMLKQRFGGSLPPATLARVALAAAVAIAVGRLVPAGGKLLTLLEAALTAAVYLGVLVATREIGRNDVAAFARVLRRRR